MSVEPEIYQNDANTATAPAPARANGAATTADLASMAAQIEELSVRSRTLSTARGLCFLVLLGGLFGLAEAAWIPLVISLPALLVFIALLYRHGSVLDERRSLERRRALVEEELSRRYDRRRKRDVPELPTEGAPLDRGIAVYREEAPSFRLDEGVVDDLNVLRGPRNLFSFLDVSSTEFGARRLRHLLTHVLESHDEIRARQQAARELAERRPQRREILEALMPLRDASFRGLAGFFDSPTAFAGRRGLWLLAHLFGSLVPAFILLAAVRVEFIAFAFLFGIINLGIIGSQVKQSNRARDRLLRFGALLDGLVRLDDSSRRADFESPRLKEIGDVVRSLAPAAARLRRHVTLLGFHAYGVIFEILNVVLLWELRILPPAETLFRKHRELLERATGALGDLEALLSLACPLDEQDGFMIPEILEGETPRIEAESLGHPLLESDVVVRNDLSLGSHPPEATNVIVLSGSNMSGKSTYLKATGLNTLLAGIGAPVCAASFRWTPMRLYSDINVRDSLDDGKSYFQVEVERVLETIRAAQENPMFLAIFDELFRGTNTDERVALARSILRYVEERRALLLVATHDNALTELPHERTNSGIANFHLREDVRDGEMVFDYRVRPGPATTRNAIRVLEASGYPEEITREARDELSES